MPSRRRDNEYIRVTDILDFLGIQKTLNAGFKNVHIRELALPNDENSPPKAPQPPTVRRIPYPVFV